MLVIRRAPVSLSPGKNPYTQGRGIWVGPRASLDGFGDEKISCPCRNMNLRPPARSWSPCWLGWAGGSVVKCNTQKTCFTFGGKLIAMAILFVWKPDNTGNCCVDRIWLTPLSEGKK
jgi:hypothetical protein